MNISFIFEIVMNNCFNNIICLDCLIDLILPSLMKEGGWNPNKLECDVKLAIFSFTKLYILNTINP